VTKQREREREQGVLRVGAREERQQGVVRVGVTEQRDSMACLEWE
jgi:hypothetical protein